MGAYTKLNNQNAYITSRTAHKTISLTNLEYESQGITLNYASGSLYNSIKQLYYPSTSEGNVVSHSYDYYEQTTLYNPDTRVGLTSASLSSMGSLVMSIPKSLYGTYIKPGRPFELILFNMLEPPYILDEFDYWPDVSPYSDPPVLPEDDYVYEEYDETVIIRDDEEGGLYVYGTNPRRYVGDIIYSHGILVINDPAVIIRLTTTSGLQSTLTWKTSHPIFTHTYHCQIKESEFNSTYNPSATNSAVVLEERPINILRNPESTIADQNWTIENLDVSRYSDGTPIPQITGSTAWANAKIGAWCHYENSSVSGSVYGKLYNWYAVAGIHNEASRADPTKRKKLAPSGYHIPTDIEWTTLTTYLGGEEVAGSKLKEAGTLHWNSPNTDSTNESGFTGLPAGVRITPFTIASGFQNIGNSTGFWTTLENDSTTAQGRSLNSTITDVYSFTTGKETGLSVRCIYDGIEHIYPFSKNVSNGVVKNNLTGSSFQPYITTVGLYNDTNELIAVGKMGQPIPKSANTEMTIVVKIDI